MKLGWPTDKLLRRINYGLLVIIIVCNGYVLVAPFWPQLTFAVQTKVTKPVKVRLSDDTSLNSIDRSYDHLIIPKLQLDERIYDGTDPGLVNLGVWRRPLTAQPGQGSNTVLVGHRFTYSGASIFYHLNQLQPGDQIAVVWHGQLFIYRSTATERVEPTAVYVEDPTTEEKLTLYTCDPMWSVRYRLVVTAGLERRLP